MTTLDRPDSTTVLPEETAALIEVFVAGFQSAKTRCNYRANLRAWFGWADAVGIDGLAAQRPHVEAHIRHLEQRGYAPNTICQRIASLSSFYQWAVSEGHVAGNPVAGARRPRKPTESTASGLSRHELTDFLDAAEARGGDGYACACLLALGRAAGRRALRDQRRGPRRVDLAPHPHAARPDHQGGQGRCDRPRAAHGASHQTRTRGPSIRRRSAQSARAAYDQLQLRLPRQGAVPRHRRCTAHHAAQSAALGDHPRPRCRCRAARRVRTSPATPTRRRRGVTTALATS